MPSFVESPHVVSYRLLARGAARVVRCVMEAGNWADLSDEELLEKKISQLGLSLDAADALPHIMELVRQARELAGRLG